MSRVAITEYAAKKIIIGDTYKGVSVKNETLDKEVKNLPKDISYAVKVDVGIKKRGKQGLLRLNVEQKNISKATKELFALGHERCIIEEMSAHKKADEKYISIELVRDGALVLQSEHGGVEIEQSAEGSLKKNIIPRSEVLNGEAKLELSNIPINDWLKRMQQHHFSFLEVNPYTEIEGGIQAIDMAVEIDSTKSDRLPEWMQEHIIYKKATSKAECEVLEQDARTQATLNLHTLNPDGSVLTLLSGGGASLTALDSLVTAKLSDEVINYSEYSGAPTRDETALYVKTLLTVLFASKAKKKIILIAGGVANFTDVMETFAGIVDAFTKELTTLKEQNISVVVRRGGPNQVTGLSHLRDFLIEHDIKHEVHDPTLSLGDVGPLVSKFL